MKGKPRKFTNTNKKRGNKIDVFKKKNYFQEIYAKKLMLKYCASVMDPKDLKSMISKHQNHILGSLGFQIHSNTRNKKLQK